MQDKEGLLTFNVPYWGGKNDVPWLSITDDFGDIVHGIFLDPTRWNGKNIHGLSDIKTFDEMTAEFELGEFLLFLDGAAWNRKGG